MGDYKDEMTTRQIYVPEGSGAWSIEWDYLSLRGLEWLILINFNKKNQMQFLKREIEISLKLL